MQVKSNLFTTDGFHGRLEFTGEKSDWLFKKNSHFRKNILQSPPNLKKVDPM